MMRRFIQPWRLPAYAAAQDGVAAVEFAIWLAVLAPTLISGLDLGLYAYEKIQVANASQSAVQAGWAYWKVNCPSLASTAACDTANSNGFSSAVKTAITQASTLAITAPTSVTSGTSESEGSYCPTTSGTLATTGCPSGWTNGYYYSLTVTYTYRPLFAGASVTSLLPASLSQTSWVRLK